MVSSQQQDNGKVGIPLRIKNTSTARKKHKQVQLIALKYAVTQKFRYKLLGNRFVVYTDSNPISYLPTAKSGVTKMIWAGQFEQFDFEVKFRSGKSNQNADSLSQKPVPKVIVLRTDTQG